MSLRQHTSGQQDRAAAILTTIIASFAAGLLSGWSTNGTRPQFKLVTGVSAGALIAPFAYLGPAYDDVIRTVATAVGPDDVFERRNVLVGLASDGMADSGPLARLYSR